MEVAALLDLLKVAGPSGFSLIIMAWLLIDGRKKTEKKIDDMVEEVHVLSHHYTRLEEANTSHRRRLDRLEGAA